jgi:hypothetical protein
MSDLHEQIELLRAELRDCIDSAERFQILGELDAALVQAADEACDAGEFAPFGFPTG